MAACVVGLNLGQAETPQPAPREEGEMQQFLAVDQAAWTEVLSDPCTREWREHWTRDGELAVVTNGAQGMVVTAGPTWGDEAGHEVLWTKQAFSGDIRVDFTFTRLDHATRGVNILYLFATGSGIGPYRKDIAAWSSLRQVPSMKAYFDTMNLYHISFAAFGSSGADPDNDYIRARRYMPAAQRGLSQTDFSPDYLRTGLFQTGVPHAMCAIRHGDDLFLRVRNPGRELLCHWKTGALPPVIEGRIGLRLMSSRSSCFRDFRVSTLRPPNPAASPATDVAR